MKTSKSVCRIKMAFKDKASAIIKASISMRSRKSDTKFYRAYRCNVCNRWHLTSKRAA